ncbi:hypothetical protein BOTBODRAFT_28601 [Botryobasidium botryosum FD-172 SS1]|uniref:Uncharacterized protein n=1 Tax=Botryobasidium botryosum (strain FD-172 SS1) TaxID=930990 RepID=A0A067MTN3_BOTB1|nr:hypothetical protein BOTBODRAFT_28601 [Botryobasidium botryosum FD-172 SS1]
MAPVLQGTWAAPKGTPILPEPRRGAACDGLRAPSTSAVEECTSWSIIALRLKTLASHKRPNVTGLCMRHSRVEPPRMGWLGGASPHTLPDCPVCFGAAGSWVV